MSARLTELTTQAVGSDPEQSQRAAGQLTNAWKNDPQFTKGLLDAANQRKANPLAQANTANILNSLDARKLMSYSNEVSELIGRAPANNVQFQQNARMLN